MGRIGSSEGKKRRSKKAIAAKVNAKKRWNCNLQNVPANVSVSEPTAEGNGRPNTTNMLPNNNVSTSEGKLSAFIKPNQMTVQEQVVSEYILVHMGVWKDIFMNLNCSECGFHGLTAEVPDSKGFAARLTVSCSACGKCLVNTYSSPKTTSTDESTRPPFDANRKTVNSFLSIGKGHAGMEQFCMTMGMNCMSASTYNSHLTVIKKVSDTIGEEVIKKTQSVVRQAHLDANPALNEHDIIDISVSYDGTGAGVVIDVLTGIIIDFYVVSNYCSICVTKEKELSENSVEFKDWFQIHKESGKCEKNFSGSANAMESFAAGELWKRSANLGKFQYTTIICDGDAKTHHHLQSLDVYGSDVQISKAECLNHVSKRLGTGLRNKVKEYSTKGKPLGGKKAGSLKEETIVKLTNYYRSSIKKNIPNVDNMKSAVYATLYHCMSTDEKPQHFKCPGGELSWCFYNRAIAKGEKPPKHEGNRKTFLLPHVVTAILPVYIRLASNELLERCLEGKTQNANESFHSVLWNKCPKETFVSRKKVEIAMISAVSEFNMGCEASLRLIEEVMGKKVSLSSEKLSQTRDKRRLQNSAASGSKSSRTERKKRKKATTAQEKKKKKSEGPTYGSGQF